MNICQELFGSRQNKNETFRSLPAIWKTHISQLLPAHHSKGWHRALDEVMASDCSAKLLNARSVVSSCVAFVLHARDLAKLMQTTEL